MPINDFKVLTRFSEISSLSFIFRYIFRIIFISNKVFYFSQINVFIDCHLSKVYFRLERRAWSYLAQSFRVFIPKSFDFLFRKKRSYLKIAVSEFSIFLKSKFFLPAIFLKLIFNQKKKSGFIWPETFVFYFKNI